MSNTGLVLLAILGQLLSVFPFVVLCEGVGFDGYFWWHYFAIYAVIAVFRLLGRLCGAWAINPRHSRSFKPKAFFLSRAAVTVPIIAFFIVCSALGLSTGLYIYVLPAAIIMFFGGHSSNGREYTDIFTRGWFALYFVAGVITNVIIWFTRDEELIGVGGFQLCFGFGVLIILAAVLTNQTNIDTCTHQRDSGKMVLPQGLRKYNAWLVTAVVSLTVCLFLFTKPVVELISAGFLGIVRGLLWLLTRDRNLSADDDILSGSDGGGVSVGVSDNSFAEATTVLLAAALIAVMWVFRRQIAELLRALFAPLFRVNEPSVEAAYSDEVSELPSLGKTPFSRRRKEQQLYKQFRREADSAVKFRLGYKLMLLRLGDTPFATLPTDNTDIHRFKGENGLRNEKVERIVRIYNEVRYNAKIPTAEEIALAENFIEEIRR